MANQFHVTPLQAAEIMCYRTCKEVHIPFFSTRCHLLPPEVFGHPSNKHEDLLNERFTFQFQSVHGEKQKEKAPHPFAPGKFFGMTKPAPETPRTVKPHLSRVQQTKPAPETPPTIQTPFQHNPLVVISCQLCSQNLLYIKVANLIYMLTEVDLYHQYPRP